jgi:predicted MFS family arabinose efflux permease
MQSTVSRGKKFIFLSVLSGVVFLNITARLILAPLIPNIQKELGISLTDAGGFFLIVSIGTSITMILSGFVASRLTHKGAIALSLVGVAAGLLVVAFSPSLLVMRIGLFLVGVGAGLYPPSGMSVINTAIGRSRRGLALAMHEIGATFAYIMVPVLVIVLMRPISWRGIFLAIAAACVLLSVLVVHFGKPAGFPGAEPRFSRMGDLFRNPLTFTAIFLYAVSIGGIQGVYALLPAYLTSQAGLDVDYVNLLVSVSRVSGIACIFLGGLFVDRFGSRKTISFILGFSAFFTILLGCAQGYLLVVAVIMQPALLAAFFPAGHSAVSKIGRPETRNITFSIVMTLGGLFGTGLVPAVLGVLGDNGVTEAGFIGLGLFMACGVVLLFRQPRFGK